MYEAKPSLRKSAASEEAAAGDAAVAQRVQLVRERFTQTACQALAGWRAEKSLVPIALNPSAANVSAAEAAELRILASETLRDCAAQISVW